MNLASPAEPPDLPLDFWTSDPMWSALATWHMGKVIRTYRICAGGGASGNGAISQETMAQWLGITQTQLSRAENGEAVTDLRKLARWATALKIPDFLLWFKVPGRKTEPGTWPVPPPVTTDRGTADRHAGLPVTTAGRPDISEADEVHRRELLRLLTVAGAAPEFSQLVENIDWERVDHFAGQERRPSSETIEEYAKINVHLWHVFATAKPKRAIYPQIRQHLDSLIKGIQWTSGANHRRLCVLASDLLQLAGEVFFDGGEYTDAAHCYTLAATAGKEAGAFDLWACALTRHAFIGVYERQFDKAVPMLELATAVARRGDGELSTRYWVQAVRAQALAGAGDLASCRRALDAAEQVHLLAGPVLNRGWIRFDGSRLDEERGACYVELRRPDLAEAALTGALDQDLSARRRGIVLSDLATVGAQRRDIDRLVMYGAAAVDTAKDTRSGVIVSRLLSLQSHLSPFLFDRHVRHLNRQISILAGTSAA